MARISSRRSGPRAVLRQWRYPREFRIAAAAWPAAEMTGLARLAEAELAKAELAKAELERSQTEPPEAETGTGVSGKRLADLATGVWRMRQRLDRMPDPPRPLVRPVESALDALDQAGVVIRDHTGEPFDPGQQMSVVAYQATPGLTRETVIETIRPGVYVGRHGIQMAEVVVGTPAEAEGDGTT